MMLHRFLYLLMMLCAGHALCDYPLQGQFLSSAKNHKNPVEGIPAWQAMLAHCFIHMGMVLLITGSLSLAMAELVIHYFTDYAKCEGWINFYEDQAIHYTCKFVWACIAVRLVNL